VNIVVHVGAADGYKVGKRVELRLELMFDWGSVHLAGKLLVRTLELRLERELDSMSGHLRGMRWVRELELGLEAEFRMHLTGVIV